MPQGTSALACAVVTIAALLNPALARAWSEKFHEEAALQSARLMPTALQSVLAQNSGRLREGAKAPLALSGNESLYLHAGGTYGTLDQAILLQSQRVLDRLAARAPMSMVAYEFGVLSHYTSLAENPLHAAADDPREAEWAEDFQRFAEQRIPRFKVVFDGYLSPALERDDVRGFVHATCDRSRSRYALLVKSYRKGDGSLARGSEFDDRHPVFGVAALAYSRSISDTAKLWLWLWIQAGGDTTGLPFPQGLRNVPLSSGTGETGP